MNILTEALSSPPVLSPWDYTVVLTPSFPFLPQGLVAPTSAVRTADVCPGAYYVMTGTWTTVVTAVIRTPVPQPAAEVSDRDHLDPLSTVKWRGWLVLMFISWVSGPG